MSTNAISSEPHHRRGATRATRWVGLVRVSSETQAREGGSIEAQRDAIWEWVKLRGETLVDILADEGVSGTMEALGRREGLATALKWIHMDRADGIVVTKLDRIGRETYLQESVLYDLQAHDAVLGIVDSGEMKLLAGDPSDPEFPFRVLMRKVLFAFSEYERNLIKARSAAGIKRKKAMGGYVGGGIPYGWRIDNRSLVENPAEMAAIAQARTMRRLGATFDTIGEFFASWGVRLRRGSEWRRETVRGVINRANADNYPPPAELSNMARAFMGMPLDPNAE